MPASHNISIRLKFIVLALIILVFSFIAGLTFLHSENTIEEHRELAKSIENYFTDLHALDENLMQIVFQNSEDSISTELRNNLALFNQTSNRFTNSMNVLLEIGFIETDTSVKNEILTILSLSKDLKTKTNNIVNENIAGLNDAITISTYHSYIDRIYAVKTSINEKIYKKSVKEQKQLEVKTIILLSIGIIILMFVIFGFALSFDKSIYKILDFIKVLEIGGRPEKLRVRSNDEFQDISERLNSYLDHKESKILFLKTIGKGEEISTVIPDRNDILGNELNVMAERLNKVQQEEKERQNEEQKRSWKTYGIAQFGEILRSERENVQELSFKIIQKLVTYLKIEMGTLFLTADAKDEEEAILESMASYAYDRRKFIKKSFKFGEGLPGTCALEKEKIYINDIPEEYSDVISGVGHAKPRFVLLAPLKIEEEIFGIVELASFRELQEYELEFVDELAESIASTLAGVKTNENTAVLLKQSQEQAVQLMYQEDEMKINMKELQKAQEESRKNESEITGILNAMNESSLVAEFDMNGRFSKINDKFLSLLESPREQIQGKNHHEFAVLDKYSDAYKLFWETLRKGKTVSTQEQFKLYSGKDIWLQQTYTPIYNDQGKVYKILNIAIDITQSKLQQENLEKQAAEITRKSLEMEGLNEAVNSSIIKCEIDNEGIILDLNTNYAATTGFNRKELLGRNYRLFLKDIEKEQFEKIWVDVLKDKTYEGAIRRTRPTGEEVWLMSTFSPVKDESGHIYKIYFLALDITEKRLKYQLLEEANREADRLREELQKYEG